MKEFILSNINEFDTFESFFGDAHIKDSCIVIPYINIALMKEHPLNHTNELLFINFSYLQIVEPRYISIYERGIIKNELKEYNSEKSKWYGGVFIGNDSNLDAEMEIQASDIYLIIPKGFKLSSKMWVPDYKEFRGKGNIPTEEITAFLNKVVELNKITVNFS